MNKQIRDKHEEYLAVKGHLSASSLKEAIKSPRHYKVYLDQPATEPSQSMKIGTAFHAALLEPEKYAQEYAFMKIKDKPVPDKDFRNVENKNFKIDFEKANEGKVIFTEDEGIQIEMMMQNAKAFPLVKALLETDYEVEQSFYFDLDEINGIEYPFKGKLRADYLHNGKPIMLDVKSTKNAAPGNSGFLRDHNNYKYPLQMAWYKDMISRYFREIEEVYILAVENTYPYFAQIYRVSEEDLTYGRSMYIHAMDKLKQAEELGVYHGYELYAGIENGEIANNGVIELKIPGHWQTEYLDEN